MKTLILKSTKVIKVNKIIIGVLLLLLSSCKGNSEADPEIWKDETIEVHFGSQLNSSNISSSVDATRAVLENGTGLPKGHIVGVYGIPALLGDDGSYTIDKFYDEADFQEHLFNAAYDVIDTKGTKSELEQTYIAKFPASKTGKNALSLYAYYPYTTEIQTSNNGFVVPVQLNTTDMSKTVDYLYTGQIMAGIQKTPVELPLKHALAKLDIKVYTTDIWVYDNPVIIESIIIEANKKATGSMKLSDGAFLNVGNELTTYTYPITNKEVDFLYIDEVAEKLPNLTPAAKFLLMPYSSSIKTITCAFKGADGKRKEYTIYNRGITGTPGITLEKGKTTSINLLYLPKDANISTRVISWDESATYDITFNEKDIIK